MEATPPSFRFFMKLSNETKDKIYKLLQAASTFYVPKERWDPSFGRRLTLAKSYTPGLILGVGKDVQKAVQGWRQRREHQVHIAFKNPKFRPKNPTITALPFDEALRLS